MSRQVRFVVRIDSSWNVAVECEQDPAWKPESWNPSEPHGLHKLSDPGGGSFPAPAVALHLPDAPHEGLGPPPDVEEISDLYRSVLARNSGKDGIEIFGHYLFDVLLGRDVWAEMEQKTDALEADHLELALCWPETDGDLHRLNWELMRSDDGFLVAGTSKLVVAITRLVETDAVTDVEQLDAPPRVLFVVGTSLAEKEIRPGAELHGVLRQARAGRAMRYRVLERASPRVLQQVVQAFQPEIVHFICHGGVDAETGRVYLELQTDEKDADPRRFAGQLLSDLRFGTPKRLPTIVVLSACVTAGGEGGRAILAGGHETAPMATTLVKGGIPIVLGMAGRVADITCRLFARRFGAAVLQGEPLVRATAEARQVAFAEGRDALAAADWAFPALFLARAVPADYAPVGQQQASIDTWRTIEDWITAYNLRQANEPVFCGREDLLRKFHDLFEKPSAENAEGDRENGERQRARALALFVETQTSGYGRTRLLQEFAAQSLRDGHLPVLLTFKTEDCPKDLASFAREVDRAISIVRVNVLDIGEPFTSQLGLTFGDTDAPDLDRSISAEIRRGQGQLTPRAVSLAIRADLASLLADARGKIPFFHDSAGQVVLLLDDVDRYGPLVELIFVQNGGIVDGTGLGSVTQPVPVVMTCSLGGDATDRVLRRVAEQKGGIGWLETAALGKFTEDGQDLLAYELVLLHPYANSELHEAAGTGWAFNDDVDDDVRATWEDRFRRNLKGIPQNLRSEILYLLAETGNDAKFTVKADDEVWLARITRNP